MKITLVPTAGLCNRINAIVSAFALCHKEPQISIDIFWEKNKECYADFTDLFLPIENNQIHIYPLTQFYLKPARKRNLFIPAYLRKIYFDNTYSGSKISNQPIGNWIIDNNRIYIESSNRFCAIPFHGDISDLFKPTNEIEQIIKEVTNQYTENTIGVHIRRTDNSYAIHNSPISLFYQYMDNEIEKNSNTKFYIASDDKSVKNNIITRYGNRIITKEWKLERYSIQGMKDAVAELYCLSRTNKLIGSPNSTFTILASKLNNKPLINKELIEKYTDCSFSWNL